MRCKRLFGICLLAGLASASAARADSIRPGDLIDTFDASGSFVFSGKALGGTLQIDLTTGSVESADLTVGGVAFAGTIRNHSFSRVGLDLLTLRGAQPGQLLSLEIPDSTLINYPGGPLSSASEPAYGLISSVVLSPGLVPGQNFDVLEEGELTPVPVQTVNPTSTPLPQPAIAGAALLGVLGAAQLRRRTDVV